MKCAETCKGSPAHGDICDAVTTIMDGCRSIGLKEAKRNRLFELRDYLNQKFPAVVLSKRKQREAEHCKWLEQLLTGAQGVPWSEAMKSQPQSTLLLLQKLTTGSRNEKKGHSVSLPNSEVSLVH
jgi:hypothetical protein